MRFKNFLLAFALLCAGIIGGCTDDATTQPPTTQTATEPTNHPTNFKAASGTDSSITLTWTDATGEVIPENYLIIATEHPAVPERPTDGVPPVAGLMTKTVAKGIRTVTFTNLKDNQQYNFAIYPYNGAGAGVNYKTAGLFTLAAGTTFKKEPKVDAMLPLKIGNRWTYTYYHVDSSSVGMQITDDFTTNFVARDTMVNGEKWYEIKDVDFGIGHFYQNRSDGTWEAYDRTYIPKPSLLFAYPSDVNDESVYEIISTSESVTVPAGTFTCYHYQLNVQGTSIIDYYVARNIGIIKYVSYHGTSAGTSFSRTTQELQSYVLN